MISYSLNKYGLFRVAENKKTAGMIIVENNFRYIIGEQAMDPKKKIPQQSKKKVSKKRSTKKSSQTSFDQKIFIGPGPYSEKSPKG